MSSRVVRWVVAVFVVLAVLLRFLPAPAAE
jgi:hypothetical protein